MDGLGWMVCAILLGKDVARDGDHDGGYELARRWTGKQIEGERMTKEGWEKISIVWDRNIVLGAGTS